MNYFEALANTQQNAHSKARDRRAEKAPMVLTGAEKERDERQKLMRLFNKAMTQRRLDLLKGTHAKEIKGLFQVLDSLTVSSAPAMMSYLAKCQWFVSADYGTRHDILSVIDAAIIRFRIRQGLSPMDDGLPGEPPTVFCIARHHLTGAPLS